MKISRAFAPLCLTAFAASHFSAAAAEQRPARADRVAPTYENISYGPHERNVLDFWQAESGAPTPLLIWFHGGGYSKGDKSNYNHTFARLCLESGISFASANYRYSQIESYPGPMLDGARAIQFLRLKAKDWNLDPSRFAASGSSAGAMISLWSGYHDDRANPDSDDPVERQSSRLQCVLAVNMTWPVDPRDIRDVVPGEAYNVSGVKGLFGLPPEWDWYRDEIGEDLDAKLKDAALVNNISEGDAPVSILHRKKNEEPGNIHHANFGRHLKGILDEAGIECVHRMDSDYENRDAAYQDMFAFMKKQFGMP